MRVLGSLAALPLALGHLADDIEQLGLLQHGAVKAHRQEPELDEAGEVGEEGDATGDGPSIPHLHGPREVQGPNSEQGAYDADGQPAGHEMYADLIFNRMKYNNLGGFGPDSSDPSGMLFQNVSHPNGECVDLHVDAVSGYGTAVPDKNGLFGNLAAVNMLHGIEAEFKITFLRCDTDEIYTMPSFYWSINDLDMGSLGGGLEVLTISGFESEYLLESAVGEVVKGQNGALTTYQGSTAGNEEDNPTDPFLLTDQQAGRTVSFKFPAGLSEFTFRYSVAGAAEPFPGHKDIGRHFQFSGMTSLYLCEPRPINVDFSIAQLVHSNLGNQGPDFDAPEGIRFALIADIGDGHYVDLEIHALTPYEAFNSAQNGLNGKFGQVNLRAGTDVTLEFVFLEPGTNTRVNMNWFHFSIFDLDEARHGRNKETMEINNRYFLTHYLTESSEVHVYPHFAGEDNLHAANDGNIQYMSSTKGTGRDNPTDPMVLDQQQKDRSVAFLMHDIDSFVTKFAIGAPRRGGRNINFAGAASVIYC
jgi:hypothetical protein